MLEHVRLWVVVGAWVTATASLLGAVVVLVSRGDSVSVLLVWAVPVLGSAFVGGLLVARVWGNPIGWLFLSIAVALAVGLLCDAAAPAVSGSVVGTAATVGASFLEPFPVFVLPALLLLFPDGRLASQRWRPVAWVAVVAAAGAMLGAMFTPGTNSSLLGLDHSDPLAAGGAVSTSVTVVGSVRLVVLSLVMVVAVIGLVVRFRRATGVLRQQLKWFGMGARVAGRSERGR